MESNSLLPVPGEGIGRGGKEAKVPSFQLSVFGPGVLRLFLAYTVVFFHLGSLHYGRLLMGLWAVNVFFILSGYWINHMWDNKYSKCRRSYLTFLASRYWRLAPLFLLCYVLAAAVIGLVPHWWYDTFRWARLVRSPVWWVQSMLLIYTGQAYLLPQVWSLAKEMEFYILAPLFAGTGLVARYAGERRTCLVLALMIPVLLLLWLTVGINTCEHFSLFFAGMLAYSMKWRPSRGLAILSAVLFAGLAWCCNNYTHSPEGVLESVLVEVSARINQVWPLIGAFLFIPFAIYTVNQRSSKLDRSLGDLAYAVYLFHWIPVTVVAIACPYLGYPARYILTVVAVLVGSVVLFVLFDRPMEKLRHAFVKSRIKREVRLQPERRSLQSTDVGRADRTASPVCGDERREPGQGERSAEAAGVSLPDQLLPARQPTPAAPCETENGCPPVPTPGGIGASAGRQRKRLGGG